MFWTSKDPEVHFYGKDSVTFCEGCALRATNEGVQMYNPGAQPFASMDEAVTFINALCAAYGAPDWNCTASVSGRCEECGVAA